jgi:ribA/ribD-fused uncharacterized protein
LGSYIKAMRTREELVEHLRRGGAVEYLHFWGHTPKRLDQVDASCLSQWFPCSFVIDGVTYPSAEHYMMAEKARLFGDAEALGRVLGAASPADAKKIGREVRRFDATAWGRARFAAVVRGNVAKFGQRPELTAFLRGTGDKVLVEAAPRDRVWGIGMGASNPDARSPERWRGANLLGFALMETRARLA